MRSKAQCLLCALAATISVVFAARSSLANTSSWGTRVGYVYTDDSTTWCQATTTTNGAQSSFTKVPSDSAVGATPNYASTVAAQMVRVQCTSLGGSTQVLSSGWSMTGQAQSPSCPFLWAPTLAECRINGQMSNGASTTLPYVYQGSACGNGVFSINQSTLVEELLNASGSGFTTYEPWPGLNSVSPLGKPNDTTSVGVGGADLGSVFLQAGVLNFVFGDTCTLASNCSSTYISGSLATSTSIDPTHGILLGPWQSSPSQGGPIFTRAAGEVSAVAGAGFAITSPGGTETRFLWYFSVKDYGIRSSGGPSAFLANYGGLATSVGGAAWSRSQGPRWPANSNFGPGAVWQDRLGQWIYFFGVRPQIGQPGLPNQLPYSGIRVAKVPSNVNAVTDPRQYQYWGGSARGWVTDTVGAYLYSIPADEGGPWGPEADLVSAAFTPRSEISVAYNAYANVWMMMYVNNSTTDLGVHLVVASSITGPWVEVPFDTYYLPNPAAPNQGIPANIIKTNPVYAPFTSDHFMVNAGSDVYYLATEFFSVYNVGEWHFTVNRNSTCSLTP